jgi:hypothetical protein
MNKNISKKTALKMGIGTIKILINFSGPVVAK